MALPFRGTAKAGHHDQGNALGYVPAVQTLESESRANGESKVVTEERIVLHHAIAIDHRAGILHEAVTSFDANERPLRRGHLHSAAKVEHRERLARRQLARQRRRVDQDARKWPRSLANAQEAGPQLRERPYAVEPRPDGDAEQALHSTATVGKVFRIRVDFGLYADDPSRMPGEPSPETDVGFVELTRNRPRSPGRPIRIDRDSTARPLRLDTQQGDPRERGLWSVYALSSRPSRCWMLIGLVATAWCAGASHLLGRGVKQLRAGFADPLDVTMVGATASAHDVQPHQLFLEAAVVPGQTHRVTSSPIRSIRSTPHGSWSRRSRARRRFAATMGRRQPAHARSATDARS